MPVTIKQFGGHTGSFAGDCAVVTIEDKGEGEIFVLDTGATKVWRKKNELTTYVSAQLTKVAKRPVNLVTTHFHEDHYNEANIPSLKVTNHIYPEGAAKNYGLTPDKERKNWPLKPGVQTWRAASSGCLVRFYVPSGGEPKDQNDQCMAVHVECAEFSYLCFGDMTRKAYARLVEEFGKLPRATTTKYPHHGNFSDNYLDYYLEDLSGTAVLISGNSRSDVNTTINTLLKYNAGAVYCLARTSDAISEFQGAWKTTDKPVYICRDATLVPGASSGVSITDGMYLTSVTEGVSAKRKRTTDKWLEVKEDWKDDEGDKGDVMEASS